MYLVHICRCGLLVVSQSLSESSVLCVSATVKLYLKDNMPTQTSAITLAHIAALERKLTKNFKVQNFTSLEQGTFLEFLVKHIQVECLHSLSKHSSLEVKYRS